MNPYLLPRLASTAFERAAAEPITLVSGARGVGKRTLCEGVGAGRFHDLDDIEALAAARAVTEERGEGGVTTIIEAQRDPAVVRRILGGRAGDDAVLMTASLDLAARPPEWADLLGDAAGLTLWPLTRYEQLGDGVAGLWGDLLSTPLADWPDVVLQEEGVAEDWEAFARRGGLPGALAQDGEEARRRWFRLHTRAYLERDVVTLSDVGDLLDVRRLMGAACRRLGEVANQAELARETGISGPTAFRYLNLLEASYQLVRLEALQRKGTRRLVKSPKLYWSDTGLALFLSGGERPGAGHLENLVLGDLLAWRDSQLAPAAVNYWRTQLGEEVDFVLEWGGRLLPIQVRASPEVDEEDAREIEVFAEQYGVAVAGGLVLHTGEEVFWLADGVLAAPWWRVF